MNKIKMIALIDDQGILLNQKGIGIEGEGIFDLNGNPFNGGISESGELFAAGVDSENYLLNSDGERIGWKIPYQLNKHFTKYLRIALCIN